MWERSLFKQRNMHWPRQRIQLQLSTRIFGQSMWNWWAVCLAVIFIVYRLENLYTNWRCWSCMFTCCCFYMKKRFIGIYSFLSQVSIRWSQYAVKNPPLKWFLVSFFFCCCCCLQFIFVIIVSFRYKRVWEQTLFKQRNLHWPNQCIQLQLLAWIFWQSMWNWLVLS